ncbi:Uncharacterised protein [Klebsiella pneumoniae]|nr:Uncharacterised protein [Klebsiella pneumoniae]
MTLIEALTGPDGRAWQPFNQVFTLHVSFTEGRAGGFPVILLRNGVRYVGVEIEALVAFFPHFLAQFQFGVGFTFVTETVFTLCACCLETLLFTATSGPANAGTSITFKVYGARLGRQDACRNGDSQRDFAQSNHYSIS